MGLTVVSEINAGLVRLTVTDFVRRPSNIKIGQSTEVSILLHVITILLLIFGGVRAILYVSTDPPAFDVNFQDQKKDHAG